MKKESGYDSNGFFVFSFAFDTISRMKKTSKQLFVFFVSVLFASSPAFFASAQSDGSAPPPTDGTGSAVSAPVLAPAETPAPVEAAPRAVPASIAVATSAPATVTPKGTPKPPPPVSVSPNPTATPPTPMPVPPPTILPPATPASESQSSFPYALIALAVALVIAPYGMARILSKNKVNKDETKGNRCDDIKKLLERKKSTLGIVSGTISLKQILIDTLVKKIEEKKEELEDEVTTVVIDTVAGEEGGKIIQSAKEVKETYETLVEDLEQAKRALEYFTDRQKKLNEDISKIESAYQTCMLGSSVFEGASRLGRGLEIFEASLNQKLYRYTSQEKDVFSGDTALGKNLAEMAEAGKWLESPKLPEGSYRFFLTEKGKEEYEKSLLPLHKKYLSDISCKEADFSEIKGIVYEDEWQVVAQNKD